MSLFDRGKRQFPQVPTEAPTEDAPAAAALARCEFNNCTGNDVAECAYVDRRGRRCDTSWCSEHGHHFGGDVFCIRHFNVVKALVGSRSQRLRPEKDNRAAGLVAWVSNDVNGEMQTILELLAIPSEDESVSVSPLEFNVHSDGSHRWEREWMVKRSGSDRIAICLDATEEMPETLQLRVNSDLTWQGIPPWVGSRSDGLQPKTDPDSRQNFYRELLDLLRESLAS